MSIDVESLKPDSTVSDSSASSGESASTERPIGSGTSSARIASTRTFSVPPSGPRIVDGDGAAIAKSPSRTMRETSSSGSCWPSGSLPVFQLKLPNARRADLTCAGVAVGRDDLYSAAAAVTWGAAIEVPDSRP